jgi:hypothetical protein
MRPPPFEAIFESTLGTCDPHPSKSTLLTGLKQVKLRPMLIRIGADCVFVRGDSEYGTPVAIWEMLHNSIFCILINVLLYYTNTNTTHGTLILLVIHEYYS